MATQIISGVGFLGSGIIFKDGSNVRGINTAATIWCTAAIGMFAGASLYLFAAISGSCLVAANTILRLLTERSRLLGRSDDSGHICRLWLTCPAEAERERKAELAERLSGERFYLLRLHSTREPERTVRLNARYAYDGQGYLKANEALVEALSSLEDVGEIGWEVLD